MASIRSYIQKHCRGRFGDAKLVEAAKILRHSPFATFTCPYPGRLAYIHGLPLIIVGKRHHSMRY
jgi:hypothetical protein